MNSQACLPDGRLIAWYGDDYTGAAAVLEVLSFAGVRSVLFLDTPTEEQLSRFPDVRAIGIAGTARAHGPAWMDENLPELFQHLSSCQAAINHYKICSTLDSSPQTGSIGRASELAIPILAEQSDWHALLIAAPAMQRYQAFGNLFAESGGSVHRLDRHPVMRRHPITPMHEADVRLHLQAQTDLPIGLVSLSDMLSENASRALQRERRNGASIVAIDCMDEASLIQAGELIWENRGKRHFCIGSQGIEYALVAYWRARGLLDQAAQAESPGEVEQIAVVSGSCSPTTGEQITIASRNGFEPIRIDPSLAIDDRAWQSELQRSEELCLRALENGLSPLVHSSSGPEDSANARFSESVEQSGLGAERINRNVGNGLGTLLLRLIQRSGISRCAIAGGDTSGHGASRLGIHALTALAPIATGAALCQAHSEQASINNLQIALKGGQMGGPDFFQQVRQGGLG